MIYNDNAERPRQRQCWHIVSRIGQVGQRIMTVAIVAFAVSSLPACGGGDGSSSSGGRSVPTITVQPVSISVTAGIAAAFSVKASGETLTYQWQTSNDNGATWTPVPGEIAASLNIVVTVPGLSGYEYRVVVSDGAGASVTSSAATLTVTAAPIAPTISVQPLAATTPVGGTATFSVTAAGGTLGYQWQVSTDASTTWSDISGATAISYTITDATASMNGAQYRVNVTSDGTTVVSAVATLTVTATSPLASAPSIVQQPADQSVVTPIVATFTVQISGSPTPTIQWQVSTDGGSTFSNINGATSASYTTPPSAVSDNGKQYRAVASSSAGSASSHPATLTVISDGVGGATSGIAVDGNGNIIVSTITLDVGVSNLLPSTITQIRVITPAGSVTTLAGNSTQALVNGTGAAASFSVPLGIAIDTSGNVYVADSNVNAIRKVTSLGVVTTFAGTDIAGGFVNGPGAQASFDFPIAVAVDNSGNVFVADSGNNAIRKITSAGVVSTFAGGTSGNADGVGSAAQFNGPRGVAVDNGGNVYVADTGNYAVRKISMAGVVTTLANSSSFPSGSTVNSGSPNGIAVDSAGNVYLTLESSSSIKKISPAGGVISVSASGFTVYPNGIAVDASGDIYVGDTYKSATYPFEVRKISPGGMETEIP